MLEWAIPSAIALASALFGRKKQEPLQGQFTYGTTPKYTGRVPYSAAIPEDLYGAMGKQYTSQIMQRSRGEDVGFDPRYTALIKANMETDLEEQRRREMEELQGQFASQGLRGGIPMSTAERYMTDWQKTRQKGLNTIDIADLSRRAEEKERATYAQPDWAQQVAEQQRAASQFDLQKAQFEEPSEAYILPQQGVSPLSSALGMASNLYGQYQNTQTVNKLIDALRRSGTTPTQTVLKALPVPY